MPKDTPRSLGTSPGEVLINSGGEQFFLFNKSDSPATVSITWAQLTDGSQFAGSASFAGSPAFSTSATNYLWYRLSTNSLENNDTGFMTDSDAIPLWQFDVDVSGVVSNVLDRRPWFGGGGEGGANSIEERLKEILQHSVMEFGLIDPLSDTSDVDGASTGTFISPGAYELSPGEFLQSSFAAAPPSAPASIDQVVTAVLVDQIISTGDMQIYVSRTSSPAFPGDFEIVSDNFINHVFTGGGTNVLNVRIMNNGAGTFSVAGFGMYYNNIGGPTGVLGDKSGIVVDASGLNIYNTNPAAYRVSAANFGFTWTVTGGPSPGTGAGNLAWAAASAAPASGLDIEITDPVTGTFVQTLVSPGDTAATFSIPDVGPGGYLYFDIDRVSPNVTLQYSVGPPVMIKDRFILGKRVLGVTGVNDTFALFNNHILPDSNTIPQSALLQVPPSLLTNNQLNALKASNAPTGLNPIATIADIPGVAAAVKSVTLGGLGTQTINWSALGISYVLAFATDSSAAINGFDSVIIAPAGNVKYWPGGDGTWVAISAFPSNTPLLSNTGPNLIRVQNAGGVLTFTATGSASLFTIGF